MKVRTMSWIRTLTAGFVLAGFAGTWGYLHSAGAVGTSSSTNTGTTGASVTTSNATTSNATTPTGTLQKASVSVARTSRRS